MVNESRIDIYDYLYNLFYGVVTENVYAIAAPQELTPSDVEDGFITIEVGNIIDESEFTSQAYAYARCYVTAYIPPISRGRLDYDAYAAFEDAINEVIDEAAQDSGGDYHVQEDSVLSMDLHETTNINNTFYAFVKSFVVEIEVDETATNENNTL